MTRTRLKKSTRGYSRSSQDEDARPLRTRISTDVPEEDDGEDEEDTLEPLNARAIGEGRSRALDNGSGSGNGSSVPASSRPWLERNNYTHQPRGRPVGATNRIPAYLRAVIMQALEAAGGEGGAVAYMTRLAKTEPAVFGALLKRLLPVRVVDNSTNDPVMTVDAVQLAKLSPQQRDALKEALRILMPDRFNGFPNMEDNIPEIELQKIEYSPDD